MTAINKRTVKNKNKSNSAKFISIFFSREFGVFSPYPYVTLSPTFPLTGGKKFAHRSTFYFGVHYAQT